jgi:hypothetical protein
MSGCSLVERPGKERLWSQIASLPAALDKATRKPGPFSSQHAARIRAAAPAAPRVA